MLESFRNSPCFYSLKSYTTLKYFETFTAFHLDELVVTIEKAVFSGKYETNPFLYCFNPIQTGLQTIELLR